MPVRRRLLGVLAVAGVIAALGQARAAEAPPPVIRLGGQGAGFGLPFGTQTIGIMHVKGILEEEFKGDGVKVEYTFFQGTGPAINEALANGQLDFANYGGLPNIVGRAGGLKTKILASYGAGNAYVAARKGTGIAGVGDLRGRKVAVARGTINHLSMSRILAEHGLKEKDLQIVDLKAGDQLTALGTGDIDAAFGSTNFLALRDKGIVDVVYSTKGRETQAHHFGAFTTTEGFAAKYPETTRRVVKAFVKAAHWASLEENRAEVLAIWAKSGTPLGALTEDFEGAPLSARNNPLVDDLYVAKYRYASDFAIENRFIRQPVDLASWIDRSYVDAALAELGLGGFWPARDAEGRPAEGRS